MCQSRLAFGGWVNLFTLPIAVLLHHTSNKLRDFSMRFVVYLVAVLAAAGIVYFVSNTGEPQVTDAVAPAEGAETAAEGSPGETQLVSLKVPDMHCPVACYPAVKKTLEGQTGVSGVDLAEQSEE